MACRCVAWLHGCVRGTFVSRCCNHMEEQRAIHMLTARKNDNISSSHVCARSPQGFSWSLLGLVRRGSGLGVGFGSDPLVSSFHVDCSRLGHARFMADGKKCVRPGQIMEAHLKLHSVPTHMPLAQASHRVCISPTRKVRPSHVAESRILLQGRSEWRAGTRIASSTAEGGVFIYMRGSIFEVKLYFC